VRIRVNGSNRSVGIDSGRVVEPSGDFDLTIDVPGGEVRPGLINAHDHLHRNGYGRLGHPPYTNAYDWGLDIHARDAAAIAAGRAVPRLEALLVGAWKNLVSGVTTVVHHDRWEPAFDAGFPLTVVPVRSAHSLGFDSAIVGHGRPFAIHLAEGTDAASVREVHELASRGWLTPETLAVHAVGPDAAGIALLRQSGAAIVWCPTSNLFLFGRTAPRELLAPGIDVLLGSDSLLTGAGTLLDELRAARGLKLVSDERLLDAVGRVAARRLDLPPPSIEIGAVADLVVFRKPLFEATADDVAVVLAGGKIRVLDPAIGATVDAFAAKRRRYDTGGSWRWIFDD
jgi:cytosine/adenosine deaminase-related metal-dependent hydrolase